MDKAKRAAIIAAAITAIVAIVIAIAVIVATITKGAFSQNIIIMFHCLTSDTDPTGPRRLLRTQGKLVNLQEKNP